MIYLRTKFRVNGPNGSLVIATKPQAECKISRIHHIYILDYTHKFVLTKYIHIFQSPVTTQNLGTLN